jgi:hypothetical protein
MEMKSGASLYLRAIFWAWLAGAACLFLSLQFSPPRFSLDAMGGAFWAAFKSSLLYVLPPVLALAVWRVRRHRVDGAAAALAAILWMLMTVGWWAVQFNPIPWKAALQNMVLLLPSILAPCLVFWRLTRARPA